MISVDHPEWLWGLLLLPVLMLWSRSRLMSEPRRTLLALGLRSLAWTLVLLAAADVHRVQRSDDVATIVILDRTQSIPSATASGTLDALVLAASNDPERQPEDRLGVIAVGADPAILEMPVVGGQVRVPLEPARRDATDLGAAVATALSILPDDARARLVLASDGVDTEGNFGESVARATAAGIPIDVYPIRHQREAEVRVESVAAQTECVPDSAARSGSPCSRSNLRRGCFVSSARALKLIWILRLLGLVCRCNFPRGEVCGRPRRISKAGAQFHGVLSSSQRLPSLLIDRRTMSERR